MLDWKDCFTPKFHVDVEYGYFFDAMNTVALNVNEDDCPKELLYAVEKAMNGEHYEGLTSAAKIEYHGSKSEAFISIVYLGELFTFDIRGWGFLTALCKLTNKEAAEVQDDFANYIVKSFKEHIKGAE